MQECPQPPRAKLSWTPQDGILTCMTVAVKDGPKSIFVHTEGVKCPQTRSNVNYYKICRNTFGHLIEKNCLLLHALYCTIHYCIFRSDRPISGSDRGICKEHPMSYDSGRDCPQPLEHHRGTALQPAGAQAHAGGDGKA